jgi:hypothetical protein
MQRLHQIAVDLDYEAWFWVGLIKLERYLAAHAEFARHYPEEECSSD